ncbi:MAG TPA: DUF4115 domain-containing protein, partial [Bryobacteraceae bacterium]|nr:DUF4115 domain-containing protein [Bryobacteraceae bacterium]
TFDPRWNAALSSIAWSVLAVGAVVAANTYYNRPPEPSARHKSVRATPGALIADSTVKSGQKQAVPAPTVSQPAAPRTEGWPAAVEEPAAGSHPVKVTLTAREASWVQITADGKPAFTGTLQPNDQQNVSADDTVKVVTGNAGGVEISLNGKPIDPLGPSGQVRTVRLTAEGPQFVAKVPPSTSDPL